MQYCAYCAAAQCKSTVQWRLLHWCRDKTWWRQWGEQSKQWCTMYHLNVYLSSATNQIVKSSSLFCIAIRAKHIITLIYSVVKSTTPVLLQYYVLDSAEANLCWNLKVNSYPSYVITLTFLVTVHVICCWGAQLLTPHIHKLSVSNAVNTLKFKISTIKFVLKLSLR